MLHLPYEEQLALKEKETAKLLKPYVRLEGIIGMEEPDSPVLFPLPAWPVSNALPSLDAYLPFFLSLSPRPAAAFPVPFLLSVGWKLGNGFVLLGRAKK